MLPTVDGSEIPNNHLGWWKNPINNENNGIIIIPWWLAGFQDPSTV